MKPWTKPEPSTQQSSQTLIHMHWGDNNRKKITTTLEMEEIMEKADEIVEVHGVELQGGRRKV